MAFDASLVTDHYNEEIHNESYKSYNFRDNDRRKKDYPKHSLIEDSGDVGADAGSRENIVMYKQTPVPSQKRYFLF